MSRKISVLFVCEHGAAKSVIAATYFNQLASQMNLDIRAIARGTNPDAELSTATISGLERDGLKPSEPTPQKLSLADTASAHRVIAFCEVPAEYAANATVEQWDGVPPVSENYERARDVIVGRIQRLLSDLQ